MNDKVIIKGVIIDDQCIRFSDKVKNVGLWLDSNLTFNFHINGSIKVSTFWYKIIK